MNFIGFVPIRGGSKGIPRKNIKDFCGRPLFTWVVNEMLKVKDISHIFISTEDEDIKNMIMKYYYGNENRRVSINHENKVTAGDPKIHWEAAILEMITNCSIFEDEDALVMAQVTSPFTQDYDFQNAIDMYKKVDNGSLVTCARTHRFIWNRFNDILVNGSPICNSINYKFQQRPMRQDFQEGLLVENGAFCINSIGNIKRDKNRLSKPVQIYSMLEHTFTEIDTSDDWFYAEYLFKKYVLEK